MCLAGVAVGIGISLAPNSAPTDSLLFIGLSGAIAISAMLLPELAGVSYFYFWVFIQQ